MFPLRFPYDALDQVQRGSRILDPFCGRGTTNYAARLRRAPSVGVDSNPVAVAIAAAKVSKVSAAAVIARCRELLGQENRAASPEGEFWEFAYAPDTLADICRLRTAFIRDCSTREDIVLRALVLGILHGPLTLGPKTYLSNQMPRTYATKPAGAVRYWKACGLKPPRVDVLDAVSRRARFVLTSQPAASAGTIVHGDATEADFRQGGHRFDHVITSPPYYGMYTYYPDQWLRAWVLGGPETPDGTATAQLGKGSRKEFIERLALVWRRVAEACRPEAKLHVRFGSLPSAATDPEAVLRESIELADAGWEIATVTPAGRASGGKRQAEQFGEDLGTDTDEIDLSAVLRMA